MSPLFKSIKQDPGLKVKMCAWERKDMVPVYGISSISTNCSQFFDHCQQIFFAIIQSRKGERSSGSQDCQLPDVVLPLRIWLCEEAKQKTSIRLSLKPLRQLDRIACFRFGNDIWRLDFRYWNTNLKNLGFENPSGEVIEESRMTQQNSLFIIFGTLDQQSLNSRPLTVI